MTRVIRVNGPHDGIVQLVVAPDDAFSPDCGADTRLSLAEAAFLRDSLTLAIKVHENEALATKGRKLLNGRNADQTRAISDAAAFMAAADRFGIVMDISPLAGERVDG